MAKPFHNITVLLCDQKMGEWKTLKHKNCTDLKLKCLLQLYFSHGDNLNIDSLRCNCRHIAVNEFLGMSQNYCLF